MAPNRFRFDRFVLDPGERQLRRDDVSIELNARYLDALVLLVCDAGRLVTKDRFLNEVWRGVPVTDEALTQCIKTLRRQLGDDAARPRFIETVPKHGYRFIAPIESGEAEPETAPSALAPVPAQAGSEYGWRQFLLLGGAGTAGAGVAGVIGGLSYGFAAAAQAQTPGVGAASVLLVVLWLTLAAALTGGAGVSFGIAVSGFASAAYWRIVGGAAGGMIVGGVVKLLGLDAFNLLLGRSPGDITGAVEGLLLGGAVGVGAWLASRGPEPHLLRRSVGVAAIVGGAGGILVTALGGQLMGGSLDLLTRSFLGSRLRLDQIGSVLGESGFGPVSRIVTAGLEGMLFGGCIVGAILLSRRTIAKP